MSFYRYAMNNASVILFLAAIVVFFGTFILAFRGSANLFADGSSSFSNVIHLRFNAILGAIASGVSSAAWPFFGAGLIWTLQNRGKGGSE